MNLPSQYLQEALEAFHSLPSIGKKTALRLTLHMLHESPEIVATFCKAISNMKEHTKTCSICGNVSDAEHCSICTDTLRHKDSICVVENLRDLLAIEATQHFNGVYHVLGNLISPLKGIGADQINVSSLIQRVREGQITEIIFALSPNVQGDTTVYYIQKQLKDYPAVKLSVIARGIAFGGELEYADELTLSRSLSSRQPIQSYINGDE